MQFKSPGTFDDIPYHEIITITLSPNRWPGLIDYKANKHYGMRWRDHVILHKSKTPKKPTKRSCLQETYN